MNCILSKNTTLDFCYISFMNHDEFSNLINWKFRTFADLDGKIDKTQKDSSLLTYDMQDVS